jgi:hypothetical protein
MLCSSCIRSRARQENRLSCLVVVVTTELLLEVLGRTLLVGVVLVVLAVLSYKSASALVDQPYMAHTWSS